MTKRRRKARPARKRQPIRQPDRASNPTVHWIRGLAAMGDERWNEAIASMERFLDLVPEGLERRQAYRNLAACYLAMERYDDFVTPYGNPMQGTLIYVNQRPGPGFMISTLGL